MRSRQIPKLIIAMLGFFLFLFGTRPGAALRNITLRSWVAQKTGRELTLEQRRGLLMDQSYFLLLEINKRTPENAVILLPPRELLRSGKEQIPLAASASATYTFIYPRVPVHYGEKAPYRDRVTHVLNYDHWALVTFWPNIPLTEENRFGILPWPGGRSIP